MMNTSRKILLTASALGFLTVAIGAFGAHGLKNLLLQNNRTDTFELAVKYQFYHTIALLIVGSLYDRFNTNHLKLSALFFLIGIILFCGSLYLLSLCNSVVFGAITPLGGIFFLFGWAILCYSVYKQSL